MSKIRFIQEFKNCTDFLRLGEKIKGQICSEKG